MGACGSEKFTKMSLKWLFILKLIYFGRFFMFLIKKLAKYYMVVKKYSKYQGLTY